MEAYHIKTVGGKEWLPFSHHELHAIYIPKTGEFYGKLVGFLDLRYKKGIIKEYNLETCRDMIGCIINNQKDFMGEEIKGEVISKFSIDIKKAKRIAKNYDEMFVSLTKEFDNSTKCLIGILSWEYRHRSLLEIILGV